MQREMDFFYFIGSTYSYLSVVRAQALADQAGIVLRWRPFSVRTLMREQNNVPFATKPVKMQYMWRDIERRAATHGLTFVPPPVWPTDPELLHNLVGALAASQGWGEAFTVASFKAWIVERMPLGDPATLEHVLAPLGKDADAVISQARSPEVAALYQAETDLARSHGVFGSPSFVADGEMFWGDDRLEEALAWATGTHKLQAKA